MGCGKRWSKSLPGLTNKSLPRLISHPLSPSTSRWRFRGPRKSHSLKRAWVLDQRKVNCPKTTSLNSHTKQKWTSICANALRSWGLSIKTTHVPLTNFSSVAQSCPTLCDPMDCSMAGFPVHYQLLELVNKLKHKRKCIDSQNWKVPEALLLQEWLHLGAWIMLLWLVSVFLCRFLWCCLYSKIGISFMVQYQFSRSVMSNSLQPHGLQHARPRVMDGITSSQSLFKFMFIKSVMPSNHPILSCPLLLLPSIFPSIRVFSNESALPIR